MGAVVGGPLLKEEVGGGWVYPVVEPEAVQEDGEVEVRAGFRISACRHGYAWVRPVSRRWRSAIGGPALVVAGSAGG